MQCSYAKEITAGVLFLALYLIERRGAGINAITPVLIALFLFNLFALSEEKCRRAVRVIVYAVFCLFLAWTLFSAWG